MDKISANITEIPEKISANISEPKVVATYEMDFPVDSTNDIWAFVTKHFGNITAVELTNIDSYTIDGAAAAIPFAVVLDKTYMIEIIKTNPSLAATIKFTVVPSAYNELQNVIDFSIGDGRWSYYLGDTTNINTLYRYDDDLFTVANYAGAGAWTISAYVTTINLPVLPANAYWSKVTNLKDGWILVSGGTTSNANKYFCKVSALTATLDNIIDLDGTPNAYTTLSGGQNLYPLTDLYDYINGFVYFKTVVGGSLSFIRLNLNTNTLSGLLTTSLDYTLVAEFYRNKVFFNPYRQEFASLCRVNIEEEKNHALLQLNQAVIRCGYNRVTNEFYKSNNNNFKNLYVFDEFSRIIGFYTSVGAGTYTQILMQSIDHNNSAIVGMGSNNYYSITRILDDNKKAFTLQNPETSEVRWADMMFAKNDLHIALSNQYGRIHLIDASDPEGTVQPDFGYLDLPGKCWAMTTNRIL